MRNRRWAVTALIGVTLLLAACSPGADDSPTTTEATPSATGPNFAPCGGVDVNEVAEQTGFTGLRLAAVTTSDCQWVAPTSVRVSFNWYRGSPIDRERGGVELSKDNIVDVTIGGRSGFLAWEGTVCETGIGFDADFIEWSARMDSEGVNNVGVEKVCRAVRQLAQMSIERAQ